MQSVVASWAAGQTGSIVEIQAIVATAARIEDSITGFTRQLTRNALTGILIVSDVTSESACQCFCVVEVQRGGTGYTGHRRIQAGCAL